MKYGRKDGHNVWPTDIVQTQNGPLAQTALDSQNVPSVHSSFVQNGPSVYSSCVQNGPLVHLACVPGSLSWGAILGLDNIGWSDVMYIAKLDNFMFQTSICPIDLFYN